jgi:hypothetical protein
MRSGILSSRTRVGNLPSSRIFVSYSSQQRTVLRVNRPRAGEIRDRVWAQPEREQRTVSSVCNSQWWQAARARVTDFILFPLVDVTIVEVGYEWAMQHGDTSEQNACICHNTVSYIIQREEWIPFRMFECSINRMGFITFTFKSFSRRSYPERLTNWCIHLMTSSGTATLQ